MLQKREQLSAVYFFSLVLALFFPAFGLIAALFLIICVKWFGKNFKTGLYNEYEKYITQKNYSAPFFERSVNALNRLRSEIGFEPFIDIMRGEEMAFKLRVIEKLSRDLKKENVQLLKEAFSDPAADVRLYAAAALQKMDSYINKEIELMIKKTKSRGAAIDFAQLGNLYLKYVKSGLIEKNLTGYYLLLASQAYRSSLDIDTNHPEIIVGFVRCLFELNQHEKAKGVLDNAIKIWPMNNEIIFLRNELYFILGDFNGIIESFTALEGENVDKEKKGVWEFWTSKG